MFTTKFNQYDRVLFTLNGNDIWRSGYIVGNNFDIINQSSEKILPEYFIVESNAEEFDKEKTYNEKLYYRCSADTNNIINYTKYISDFIGKKVEYDDIEYMLYLNDSHTYPFFHGENENCIELDIVQEFSEQVADADYIRWKNQFKNVTLDDYKDIPGFNEIYENERKWNEMIEKKLDDIDDKLNKLLLFLRTWTDPYPTYPWTPGTPSNPWYDTNKPYCETETEKAETHNYTANIPLEYIHKYQETFSDSTDKDFDYKKYNNMCNKTKRESMMFGNEILENNKSNKNKSNKNKK